MSLISPTLLSFCAAVVVLAVVQTWWRRRRLLPGLAVPPAASWIWGHERGIFEAETGAKYTAWANELGPTYQIKSAWLHPNSLVTADPGAINHIFSKNAYNYHHSPVFRPLIERVIGRGLSWVEDQGEHRRMRSIVSPALTLASVRNMNGTIWNIANSFQTKLAAHIATKTRTDSQGPPSTVIDLTHWMPVVTLEVIGRVCFNHDFGLGESKEAKLIIQGWHEQASAGLRPSGFTGLVVLRTFPFITSLPVEAMQKQGETKQIVQKLARELVASSSLERNTDILSLLVTAQHREEKHKQKTTLDEIVEHITTFTVSGHETSAGVLCFALHALAQYPVIQQRLRDELLGFGHEPSFDKLWNGESFPYLEAVIKESLRLFPSAAHTEKVVQQDDVIPLHFPVRSADGKSFIREVPVRKGQVIHIPSRTVDGLRNVWGEDAGTFNPERFLNPAKMPISRDTTSGWSRLFSFSEGPRMCVGFRLALFELKVIMFMLISNFNFEDTGAMVIPRFASILQPIVQGEESKGVHLPIRISTLA